MAKNKSGKNNAVLIDVETLIQMGIDPKTKLPIKFGEGGFFNFKPANKALLKIIDRQDALGRYEWINLPLELSGELIERVLYYRGQGMFFMMQIGPENRFFFLPYALEGGIDIYGRYKCTRPLPFNGSTDVSSEDESDEYYRKQKRLFENNQKTCQYEVILPEELTAQDLTEKCVLLHDYAIGISQTNLPRNQIQDPLLDVMSDIIPFMRTALLNSTGVQGMRVGGEDEESNVEVASKSINEAALQGRKYIPITSALEFQELTGGEVAKAEEFFLALQSLDNYRLSQYGINNGGLFQKREHMLEAEQLVNQREDSYAMLDGLRQRQNFCDIVNSIWGLGIDCRIRSDIQMMGVPGETDEEESTGGSEDSETPMEDEE